MLWWFISVCLLFAGSLTGLVTKAVTKAAESGASPHGSTTRAQHNETGGGEKTSFAGFVPDSSMIQRALYVLIGITVIGLLYFLVRAVRLKKSSTQRKKYGLLSNFDDTVEMAQLESDEDDTTVYEAKSLRR